MVDAVPNLLLSESMSDVVFSVGGPMKMSRFPAHKFLLAIASPVLRKMFECDFKEKATAEVRLTDVDPDAFKSILSFIYNKKILHQTTSQLFDVLYVADKYNLSNSIYQQCNNLLTMSLNHDNFYKTHEIMKLYSLKSKPNGGKLFRKLLEVFSENAEILLQYTSFTRLDPQDIGDLIRRDGLNASESTIFEALLKWTEQQCFEQNLPVTTKNKLKIAEPYLCYVRFSHMTLQEMQKALDCLDFLAFEEHVQKLKGSLDISLYSLGEKEKLSRRQITENLVKSLPLSRNFKFNSCNQKTLLIAASQELIVTQFEFIPDPVLAKHMVKISIINPLDEILWQVNASIPCVDIKWMDNDWIPVDKKCCVEVDDVYMEAMRTYKIITCVKQGGLYAGKENTCGMQEMVLNGKLFKIVFKVFNTENVSQEDVENDDEWSRLLSSLDEKELDLKNNCCSFGVIRNVTFCT